MRLLQEFDPGASTSGTIEVGNADVGGKLLLYNQSPVNVALDFENGNVDIIRAYEANYFILDGFTPEIKWYQRSVLNLTNPPISEMSMTLYGSNEVINGTYPISFMHTVSVGNPLGVNSNVNTQQVVNDNLVAGTVVIESYQFEAPSSNVLVDNQGNMSIRQMVGGVVTTLLQTIANALICVKLGAALKIVEVLGNLQVDTDIDVYGGTGVTIHNGKLILESGSIARDIIVYGTGPGAAVHNFGVHPTFVDICYAGTFGTPPTVIPYWSDIDLNTIQVNVQSGCYWKARVMLT